ncbi:MAG TPA: alpha/beta hydrolase [Thermoanaerobaculaceae bacterium]|nr:alpha/beta hydrolase [Thermoanaerobaculaceae bacterium]
MKSRLVLGVTFALLLAGGTAGAAPPVLANGSFVAELNGFMIHYEVHGHGPVLMALPNSWGLTWEGLRALYRPLEANLTMVYFDPRGMGKSSPIRQDSDMGMAAVREDFDALRRHLGLGKVNVIGWSNGAINLILLASELPDTLASAIFLHGSPRYSQEDDKEFQKKNPDLVRVYTEFFKEMDSGPMSPEEADARVKRFNVEETFVYLWADREVGRAKLKAMYADTGFSWRHTQYQGKDLGAYDFRDRLPRIKTRALVIAGAHDLIPVERAREISQAIPGSVFVVFARSGHFAPVEEPEAFVAAVRGFLTGK